jgi:predicted nucleic acid-binding protein
MPSSHVVANAGPLNYLVLIGHEGILATLFGKVFVPALVLAELAHPESPPAVRSWAAHPPEWLEVHTARRLGDPMLQRLHRGEKAAIELVVSLRANLLLMDDRAGVAAARAIGFAVTGTLGLLDLAARRQLVTLDDAFTRLKKTNFRYPPNLMQSLLSQSNEESSKE